MPRRDASLCVTTLIFVFGGGGGKTWRRGWWEKGGNFSCFFFSRQKTREIAVGGQCAVSRVDLILSLSFDRGVVGLPLRILIAHRHRRKRWGGGWTMDDRILPFNCCLRSCLRDGIQQQRPAPCYK